MERGWWSEANSFTRQDVKGMMVLLHSYLDCVQSTTKHQNDPQEKVSPGPLPEVAEQNFIPQGYPVWRGTLPGINVESAGLISLHGGKLQNAHKNLAVHLCILIKIRRWIKIHALLLPSCNRLQYIERLNIIKYMNIFITQPSITMADGPYACKAVIEVHRIVYPIVKREVQSGYKHWLNFSVQALSVIYSF